MNLTVKNIRLLFAFMVMCTVLVSSGCAEGDGDADYGFCEIYIPQATVSNGSNNHYHVPNGNNEDTYNFRVENGKLNIILGVLRSGKISDADGFSVEVAVSDAMTGLTADATPDAMALPASLYSLPDKVTVEKDKNTAAFYLSVDIDALMDGTYDGKILVLAVEISNATAYKISDANKSVTVMLDVDDMRSVLFPPEESSIIVEI